MLPFNSKFNARHTFLLVQLCQTAWLNITENGSRETPICALFQALLGAHLVSQFNDKYKCAVLVNLQ